jgi:hypothetical protein
VTILVHASSSLSEAVSRLKSKHSPGGGDGGGNDDAGGCLNHKESGAGRTYRLE